MAALPNVPVTSSTTNNYLLTHAALQSAQVSSVLWPVTLLGYTLYKRKPFTIKKFLRQTWIPSILGAVTAAPAIEWYGLKDENPLSALKRKEAMTLSPTQARLDDYSLIGSVLGLLISPTIFLRRAPMADLLLGGAVLGMGAGVGTHYFQRFGGWGEGIKQGGKEVQEGLKRIVGDK